jgi:hypothetical protein
VDFATNILKRFSFVKTLERKILQLQSEVEVRESEKQELRAEIAKWTKFCPHGHFYSPLPSQKDVALAFSRPEHEAPFSGISFNETEQFALFWEIVRYKDDFPFRETPNAGRRYQLANSSYSPYDAFCLFGIMRRLQPRRVIEVGCGHTSAAILDLNDLLFKGRLELTFIDPDLAEFRRRLLPGEEVRSTLIEKPVQDVPNDVFSSLEANDILFLDTSHVSKVGSDVNHLLFNVLPALKPGVWVHIHDICADLDYPRHFFERGRAWNEVYLLRAFLMYNPTFEVMFSSAFLYNNRFDFIQEQLPMFAEGGGSQMWLRKLDAPVAMGAPGTGGRISIAGQKGEDQDGRRGVELEDEEREGPTNRLVNCSSRGHVCTGGNVLSLGFVVCGSSAKKLLIRAVGPGLVAAGVSGSLAHPRLQVFDSNPSNRKSGPQIVASIQGWGIFPKVGASAVMANVQTASASAMIEAGAFAFAPGSADAAMILGLPAGAYTAEVSGVEKETGVALVEIYEMP